MPGVSERTGAASGKARQHAAQRKHAAIDQAGIDAERRHHARVMRRRADHLAEPGAGKPEPEDHGSHERNANQEQIIWRHHAAGDEQRHHLEGCRHAHRPEFRAPHHPHDVVEDQDEGVADQKLHQYVGAVDPAHEHTFEDQAKESSTGGATKHRQRKAARELIGGHREISAEHIEGAVAEIHDLEHAKDQRQPDRDKKQQHADDEAAGGLRHQTGGTGETAGERIEVQGIYPLRRAGMIGARETIWQ
jgi:hypothetical protein